MRSNLPYLLLAALAAGSSAAVAGPATFEFDLPNWTNPPLGAPFGSHGVLRVVVDNGATGLIGQTYLNDQVHAASLSAHGGAFSHSWAGIWGSGSSPPTSYISTDGGGIPRFTVPAGTAPGYFRFDQAEFLMEWGRSDESPKCSAFLINYDSIQAYVGTEIPGDPSTCTDLTLVGRVLESDANVPEPPTLPLLASGLLGWALLSRRTGCCQYGCAGTASHPAGQVCT